MEQYWPSPDHGAMKRRWAQTCRGGDTQTTYILQGDKCQQESAADSATVEAAAETVAASQDAQRSERPGPERGAERT